jgi:hypothetical protein
VGLGIFLCSLSISIFVIENIIFSSASVSAHATSLACLHVRSPVCRWPITTAFLRDGLLGWRWRLWRSWFSLLLFHLFSTFRATSNDSVSLAHRLLISTVFGLHSRLVSSKVLSHSPLGLASFIAISSFLASRHESSVFVINILWTFFRKS